MERAVLVPGHRTQSAVHALCKRLQHAGVDRRARGPISGLDRTGQEPDAFIPLDLEVGWGLARKLRLVQLKEFLALGVGEIRRPRRGENQALGNRACLDRNAAVKSHLAVQLALVAKIASLGEARCTARADEETTRWRRRLPPWPV